MVDIRRPRPVQYALRIHHLERLDARSPPTTTSKRPGFGDNSWTGLLTAASSLTHGPNPAARLRQQFRSWLDQGELMARFG